MPKIKGILVVAKGAENSYLRLEIVRAIQSVLNVPVHRIALLLVGIKEPMEGGRKGGSLGRWRKKVWLIGIIQV